MSKEPQRRLAAILAVARRKEGLGRTALMKFLYFLQELRHVDLGYSFTLYTYGPFDSAVLEDLSASTSLGAVESTLMRFPNGSLGYTLKPRAGSTSLSAAADLFLSDHGKDIDWVMKVFGDRDAAGLELDSTIVYIDREAGAEQRQLQVKLAAKTLNAIKPRFEQEEIAKRVRHLIGQGLLSAIQE